MSDTKGKEQLITRKHQQNKRFNNIHKTRKTNKNKVYNNIKAMKKTKKRE